MKLIKKTLITVVGIFIVLIGIIFIVLPGPAVLIIPAGLALLALEYPIAKKWLKTFQYKMSQTAQWLDSRVRRFRQR
ncbi:PGPGW domain-containing protein [Pleionea sp. CnH1-48]|uniref:PGPGW domain-containing protein n=1 Tax=Pleionea sp. CnH1-48 TaxID=2954494 RepID=UPI0020985367|nr:PGPGW domain-containing protein [Pleionea sp. CnH1-48]MCO7227454.1 PGPGW domain-containing protein [Pleionea sp. CnH1-48]